MSGFNKDPRDIIISPVVSEKSYASSTRASTRSSWTPVRTRPRSSSRSRRSSTSRSPSINTLNRPGKTRRTKFGLGKRKDTKRAIVTLKSGSIDIFTAVG